jgi:hypothetical protein
MDWIFFGMERGDEFSAPRMARRDDEWWGEKFCLRKGLYHFLYRQFNSEVRKNVPKTHGSSYQRLRAIYLSVFALQI